MKMFRYKHIILSTVLLLSVFPASGSSLFRELAERIASSPFPEGKIRAAVVPHPAKGPRSPQIYTSSARMLVAQLAIQRNFITGNNEDILQLFYSSDCYKKKQLSDQIMKVLASRFRLNYLILVSSTSKNKRKALTATVIKVPTGHLMFTLSTWYDSNQPDSNRENASPVLKYTLPDFQLSRSSRNVYIVSGRITNHNRDTLSRPVLSIYFPVPGRKRKGVITAYCDRDVFPGETLPFRGIVRTDLILPEEVSIIYLPRERIDSPYTSALSAVNVKFSRDLKKGRILIKGELINNHSDPLYNPGAIITLIGSRKFAGSVRVYGRKRRLLPGEFTRFQIQMRTGDLFLFPDSYKIQFTAKIKP